MKAIANILYSKSSNWNGQNHKIKQLFTSLTGYDIMCEESRKDLVAHCIILPMAKSKQKIINTLREAGLVSFNLLFTLVGVFLNLTLAVFRLLLP